MTNGFKLLFITLLFVFSSCGDFGLDDDPAGVDKVTKFLGTWTVSDQPARLNYIVKISRAPVNSDQVMLNNFGDLGGTATGLVINNTIIIDLQNIGSGFKSEGTGDYMSENKLQFEFFLDDGIDKELRKATFTK